MNAHIGALRMRLRMRARAVAGRRRAHMRRKHPCGRDIGAGPEYDRRKRHESRIHRPHESEHAACHIGVDACLQARDDRRLDKENRRAQHGQHFEERRIAVANPMPMLPAPYMANPAGNAAFSALLAHAVASTAPPAAIERTPSASAAA